MLIFGAHRESKRTRHCLSADPGNIIESRPVRTAVVIGDRLPEVIAIAQRGARYPHKTGVDRINLNIKVRSPFQAINLIGKFGSQRRVDSAGVVLWNIDVLNSLVAGLVKQSRALQSGPRTNSEIRTANLPERNQAVERRVNPAVDRDIWRPLAWRTASRFCTIVPRIAPRASTKARIVVRPVDLAPKIPAQQTSDDGIGGKVLFARDACHCYGCGHAIGKEFGERPRVFVSDYAGHRPGQRIMIGRKGIASLKEGSCSVALQRPLTLRRELEYLTHCQGIDRS